MSIICLMISVSSVSLLSAVCVLSPRYLCVYCVSADYPVTICCVSSVCLLLPVVSLLCTFCLVTLLSVRCSSVMYILSLCYLSADSVFCMSAVAFLFSVCLLPVGSLSNVSLLSVCISIFYWLFVSCLSVCYLSICRRHQTVWCLFVCCL